MRRGRAGLWCAVAFFLGCALALDRPVDPREDAWLDAALGVAVSGFAVSWLARRRTGIAMPVMLLSVALLGWSHAGHALQREVVHSLVGRLEDQPELVRFEAEVLEPFTPPDPADSDLLDRFQPDANDPPWRAPVRLLALEGSDGRHPAAGVVTLVAPSTAASLEAGDVVEGVGWIAGVQAPRNPGERDARSSGWRRGVVGRLTMDVAPTRVQAAPAWMHLRTMVRRWIDANLLVSMSTADSRIQALVVAMTTGRRLPGYASLRSTFARTGLSHFLAISGFNVAVLFAMAGLLMEAIRVPGRFRGPVLLLTGALFLLLVDVEVSVLRAGVAGMLVGASLWLDRGWRGDGTLGVTALITLVIDPWAAINPGFQLSYAAVLALRQGTTPVHAVLCRLAGRLPCPHHPVIVMVFRAAGLALSASVAAWLVSTPITMSCMGNASPWCPLASTLLGPMAAAITVLASIAAVIGGVPWLGPILGTPMCWMASVFMALVEWVGQLPACRLTVDPVPGVVAALLVATMLAAWTRRVPRAIRRLLGVSAPLAMTVLACRTPHDAAPAGPVPPGEFRWTSLAVGDGSAHLLEAGGSAVLFDAGSISRQGVGSAVVVPALHALGVHALDAIVVSHPHLDHFSAVPEVVQAIPVRRVVVTDAWRSAAAHPGAPSVLLEWLATQGIPVEHARQSWSMRQGPLTWTATHPPAGFRTAVVNDGSLGFILRHDRAPDRPMALLLGDAQDGAITRYLARRDILRPWIMELPHHGGWRPLAQTLCEWVHPSFVIQSTGQRRFSRDRLSPSLADAVRGVTCRDGALRFRWSPERPASLERWTPVGWRTLAP